MALKYGFVFPGGEVRDVADLAAEAEKTGWDGVFVADCVWGVDPWVTLTAIAVRTERIRFGTMITPVSRRRPWTLAGETASLDRLSNGRLILSVGLGAIDTGFEAFGESTDRKTRAELLDEGLAILTGLWQGQPFHFDGKHYHVRETTFFPPPPPIQKPRIPIWVVGAWRREQSMQRVIRYDGLLPNKLNPDGSHGTATAEDVRAMRAYVAERRTDSTPFDIILEGRTSNTRAEIAEKIQPMADAGMTWWLESMWAAPNNPDDVARRIRLGPPG